MNEIITKIISIEWNAFDKVHNEGGRANCQDDYETFEIMRKSQFMAWNKPLLMSYLSDLEEAKRVGRNLIAEKYARMMETTAPERYSELKGKLPVISENQKSMIKSIVDVHVNWMEVFAKEFPYLAGTSREIHTSEDGYNKTSIETYLRGELGTFSEKTIFLYHCYIQKLLAEGKSLARMIMENTTKLYGYQSLKEAEKKWSVAKLL